MRSRPELHYFYNPPEPSVDKDSSKFMDKLEAENKAVMERVGMRWVYSRLVELGVFNKEGLTPLESVRAADSEVALRILSDKNAGA